MQHELWALVRSIPRGKVATYGQLGRALSNPTTGYFVGRWMAQCPDDLPWWRVVGKNGEMRTASRDPNLADSQREHLRKERVKIIGESVDMAKHEYLP